MNNITIEWAKDSLDREFKFFTKSGVATGSMNIRINNTIVAYVDVSTAPFLNCQVWGIGGFQNLFGTGVDDSEILDIVLKIYHILPYQKQLLLIDINDGYQDDVIDLFGDSINTEMPYTSSNGSNMTMYHIRMIDIINNAQKTITNE